MEEKKHTHGSYRRFFAMIATSMVVMYFLMYLNSYQILDHAWFSETRLFMTLIMGASMMAIMLAYMLGMYKNGKANAAIFVGAGLLLLAAVWLVRSQITVDGWTTHPAPANALRDSTIDRRCRWRHRAGGLGAGSAEPTVLGAAIWGRRGSAHHVSNACRAIPASPARP
jgi:hypothetical protein